MDLNPIYWELNRHQFLIPLAKGVKLPRNSTDGNVLFDNGKLKIEFLLDGNTRRILVDWPDFNQGQGVSSDITLTCPPDRESVSGESEISVHRSIW